MVIVYVVVQATRIVKQERTMTDQESHTEPSQENSGGSKTSLLAILGLGLLGLLVAIPVLGLIVVIISFIFFAETSPVLPFIYTVI